MAGSPHPGRAHDRVMRRTYRRTRPSTWTGAGSLGARDPRQAPQARRLPERQHRQLEAGRALVAHQRRAQAQGARAHRRSGLQGLEAGGGDQGRQGDEGDEGDQVGRGGPGEAARLLGSTPAAVQRDRTGAVRALSQRLGGCWVVLKGHHTLIGRTTGAIFVNPSGNPHLAQGGAGDLLAGYLAGLLAQPAWREDVATTLRYAVWQHGAAADRLQARDRHWTVEDLADELGNA